MELEPFGVSSAGDLVDLISRVSIPTAYTFTTSNQPLTPVYDKYLHLDYIFSDSDWNLRITSHGVGQSLVRTKCRHGIPSCC